MSFFGRRERFNLRPMSLRECPTGWVLSNRVCRHAQRPGWLHEIKHDGFRIMAWCDGGVTPRVSSAW